MVSSVARLDWCSLCQIHLALSTEEFICPVCLDQQRIDAQALREELYGKPPS